MAAPAQAEAPQGASGSGRPLGRAGSNMSTVSGVSGVEAGAPAHKRKGSIEHEGGPPLQHAAPHISCTLHSCTPAPCSTSHICCLSHGSQSAPESPLFRLCMCNLRNQRVCGMAVHKKLGLHMQVRQSSWGPGAAALGSPGSCPCQSLPGPRGPPRRALPMTMRTYR